MPEDKIRHNDVNRKIEVEVIKTKHEAKKVFERAAGTGSKLFNEENKQLEPIPLGKLFLIVLGIISLAIVFGFLGVLIVGLP